MIRESQVFLGLTREATLRTEVATRRAAILDALRVRVADPVPEAVRLAVEGTNDPNILQRWFLISLRVETIQEFGSKIVSDT